MKFKLPSTNNNNNQFKRRLKKILRVAHATDHFIQSIKNATNNPADLIVKSLPPNVTLIYIDNLIDDQTLNNDIIANLQRKPHDTPRGN